MCSDDKFSRKHGVQAHGVFFGELRLNGGGFVILNSIAFDHEGRVIDISPPYPGSNLFSLASGGAIYIRDPEKEVVDGQLNGGELADLSGEDWELILPYLKENETYFGISVENDLLRVNGKRKSYLQVYRKVQPIKLDALAKASAAVEEYDEEWEAA